MVDKTHPLLWLLDHIPVLNCTFFGLERAIVIQTKGRKTIPIVSHIYYSVCLFFLPVYGYRIRGSL